MYVVVEESKILLRAIFGLRLKISRPPNFRSHNCARNAKHQGKEEKKMSILLLAPEVIREPSSA
jgi:hypothetical protein